MDCPCDDSRSYDECCGPLHAGKRQAATPEELMRSRFSAYALGDADYVFRTWAGATRPENLVLDDRVRWTRLEILAAADDEVEFIAHFVAPSGPGRLHEGSRFVRRGGRWQYLDGVVHDDSSHP